MEKGGQNGFDGVKSCLVEISAAPFLDSLNNYDPCRNFNVFYVTAESRMSFTIKDIPNHENKIMNRYLFLVVFYHV